MTNIEWGAEIPVNGVRPDWLRDDERLAHYCTRLHRWFGHDGTEWWVRELAQIDWVTTDKIRLPADHEYYHRKEPASEPVAPPGYVLVKQISIGQSLAWNEDARAALEYYGIIRPETRLEQFARANPHVTITDANRDGIEAALEWGKDRG